MKHLHRYKQYVHEQEDMAGGKLLDLRRNFNAYLYSFSGGGRITTYFKNRLIGVRTAAVNGKATSCALRIAYKDEVLPRRFTVYARPHDLQGSKTALEALLTERKETWEVADSVTRINEIITPGTAYTYHACIWTFDVVMGLLRCSVVKDLPTTFADISKFCKGKQQVSLNLYTCPLRGKPKQALFFTKRAEKNVLADEDEDLIIAGADPAYVAAGLVTSSLVAHPTVVYSAKKKEYQAIKGDKRYVQLDGIHQLQLKVGPPMNTLNTQMDLQSEEAATSEITFKEEMPKNAEEALKQDALQTLQLQVKQVLLHRYLETRDPQEEKYFKSVIQGLPLLFRSEEKEFEQISSMKARRKKQPQATGTEVGTIPMVGAAAAGVASGSWLAALLSGS